MMSEIQTQNVLETTLEALSQIKEGAEKIEALLPALNSPSCAAPPKRANKHRKKHSCGFQGAFSFPDVRDKVLLMRKQGHTYDLITKSIKDTWPDAPKKHASRAAIQRFWERAKNARYEEFGIDVTTNQYLSS